MITYYIIFLYQTVFNFHLVSLTLNFCMFLTLFSCPQMVCYPTQRSKNGISKHKFYIHKFKFNQTYLFNPTIYFPRQQINIMKLHCHNSKPLLLVYVESKCWLNFHFPFNTLFRTMFQFTVNTCDKLKVKDLPKRTKHLYIINKYQMDLSVYLIIMQNDAKYTNDKILLSRYYIQIKGSESE